MSTSPRALAGALVLAAVLSFQALWVAAVPAFGGIDEFDHAYRAASVADGYWSPRLTQSALGRGALIPVPEDLVEAANERCMSLRYVKMLNCFRGSWPDEDGNVLVASAAARYNPVFYWLIGTPARPFAGADALYVMRLMTVLLSDVLLVAVGWISLRFGRTLWPLAASLLAATPVVLYATANAAPNGVQISGGLLTWAAALGLCRAADRGSRHRLLGLFVLGTAVQLSVHSTGPMWAFLTFVMLALLPEVRRSVVRLWNASRGWLLGSGLVLGAVGIADVLWTVGQKTNLVGDDGNFGHADFAGMAVSQPLWVLQTIGSVPFRNQYAPVPVFAISLVLFLIFLVLALRFATRPQRVVVLSMIVVFFVVPTVLTIVTFDELGAAWQGRYALPFACGLALLSGWILDAQHERLRVTKALPGLTAVGFGVAQAIAIYGVVNVQRPGWPPHDTWTAPGEVLIISLSAVATLLLCLAVMQLHRAVPTAALVPSGSDGIGERADMDVPSKDNPRLDPVLNLTRFLSSTSGEPRR